MAGLRAYLYASQGGVQMFQSVNPTDGKYFFTGLPKGNYFVGIGNESTDTGLIEEMYDNLICAGLDKCDRNLLTPIVVTPGTVQSGIDFNLVPGSQISGTVVDGDTGAPMRGVEINVYIGSTVVASAVTNASGFYKIFTGLPIGSYQVFAYAKATAGYGFYKAGGGCSSSSPCPLEVTSLLDINGVDFSYVRTVAPDFNGTISNIRRSNRKVSFTFMAQNSGSFAAQYPTVRFYLSKTSKLPSNAKAFKRVTISKLEPADKNYISITTALGRGDRYVIATIDEGLKISELNEKNNSSVKRIP